MSLYSVYVEDQQTKERFYLHSGREARWNFTSGGYSSKNALIFSEQEYARLRRASDRDPPAPFDLVYKQDDDTERRVKRIWITEFARAVESHEYLVWFADRRWEVERILVDTEFNVMRVANAKDRPDAVVPSNVAITAQVPTRHFLPGSCRDALTPPQNPMFAGIDVEEDRYVPWTALQALRFFASDKWLELTKQDGDEIQDPGGDPVEIPRVEKGVVDTKYLLRTWNPRSSWAEAVGELQRYARTLLYVDENGDYVLESADPSRSNAPLLLGGFGQYEGSGAIPSLNDSSYSAPKKLRIYYPRYDEVPWIYDEEVFKASWDDVANYTNPTAQERIFDLGDNNFCLENVIRCPNDVLPATGTNRPRAGEFWNIFDLLEHWKDDVANLPRPGTTVKAPTDVFTLATIQRFILSTGLAHLFQRDYFNVDYKNPVNEARVASVYNHYRTIFRIPDYWMRYIEDVRAVNSDIFSQTSRTRQPSRVAMDFNTWDTTIYRNRDNPRGRGLLRNNALDGTEIDTPGLAAAPMTPLGALMNPGIFPNLPNAPCEAHVTQKELGLLSISFPFDHSGETYRMMPGLIDPLTLPTTNIAAIDGTPFIQQMRFLPTFRMFIVLAVRWRTPNARSKYHCVTKLPGSVGFVGAKGSEVDIYERDFEAFRRCERGDEAGWYKDFATGQVIVTHEGAVGNENVINELAEADAQMLYFKFIPRVIGTFAAKGWTLAMPKGAIRSTSIQLGAGGAAETYVNAETAPIAPSETEFLSPAVRNVLGRFEKNTELGDL